MTYFEYPNTFQISEQPSVSNWRIFLKFGLRGLLIIKCAWYWTSSAHRSRGRGHTVSFMYTHVTIKIHKVSRVISLCRSSKEASLGDNNLFRGGGRGGGGETWLRG